MACENNCEPQRLYKIEFVVEVRDGVDTADIMDLLEDLQASICNDLKSPGQTKCSIVHSLSGRPVQCLCA